MNRISIARMRKCHLIPLILSFYSLAVIISSEDEDNETLFSIRCWSSVSGWKIPGSIYERS